MKKMITFVLASLIVLSISVVSFADAKTETPEWFKDMINWKRERITEAVREGKITEERAKEMNERLDERIKYHEENGFNFPEDCGKGKRGFRKMNRGFGRGCENNVIESAPSM
ncbi:DUF2680 domain-containing protein [Alkalithermobacter paradoxus]|uniref:DUF2680 domain-containing protein n=1 Tax=Alkalithermobacter paradoxus TaxID=29349 RepID=A0A1V4I8P5_9FIRM|nr:hypothetical protein CLOTH_06970 [[Clostridium] thermoalcaliphilum]